MVIYELVSKWLPNAVVNIERNGVVKRQSQYTEWSVYFKVLIAMKWVKNLTRHNVICEDKRDGYESRKK